MNLFHVELIFAYRFKPKPTYSSNRNIQPWLRFGIHSGLLGTYAISSTSFFVLFLSGNSIYDSSIDNTELIGVIFRSSQLTGTGGRGGTTSLLITNLGHQPTAKILPQRFSA
ncbi:hypothetical protein TNIN_252291 [Trichonephila inaurata madagascariensis]|uniref:Uncharacterized protein n=1 Tax=Trichonephila inaurata madagascariensis TaxID=2747483 RepID=A0A8X6XNB1_9ARAC|nr:hypothetical protein TNIN_252291 [Trichonephila inaurata madagascariensis]